MPTPGKLGKLAPVRPVGLRTLRDYALAPMPAPPGGVLPPPAAWQMFGNDAVGDCTIAGAANLLIAANALVGTSDVIPADAQAVAQYEAITGGSDTGLIEADVLLRWYTAGLFPSSNRIGGYAPVSASNLADVQSAIAYYGAAYVGVQLPEAALEQSRAGQPWTPVSGSPIEGGHCFILVGYDPASFTAVTWGGLQALSLDWWREYSDEAWAVIPSAFMEQNTGPRLDMDSLRADLHSLTE